MSEFPDPRITQTNTGLVCEHGSLARLCFICELTHERVALKAELETANIALRASVGACDDLQKDRDLWKQKAERMAEVLKDFIAYVEEKDNASFGDKDCMRIAKQALAEVEK